MTPAEKNNTIQSPFLDRAKKKLIKVCGMKFPENIRAVAELRPDFMGFIFYPKSPRYAEPLNVPVLHELPTEISKIGVFVNEKLDQILATVYKYRLNGVQLHGSEMVKICDQLHDAGLLVIKAFPVAEAYNFKVMKRYEKSCDYFLFDAQTPIYGGAGQKFDWQLLENYKEKTPFLLSGGISIEDLEDINKIQHPAFAGVDLNSRFEISPGLKNVELLSDFINGYRTL
jgi:phosphoribosylanthranilate isomerase